jgi:hypothetical protein
VSGLLGGVGVSLVLTQSGRIEATVFWALAVGPAALAAVWAGIPTPKGLDLVMRWLIIATAVISLLLGARPVLAQEEPCTLTMSSTSESILGGSTVFAARGETDTETSTSNPWTLRPEVGE